MMKMKKSEKITTFERMMEFQERQRVHDKEVILKAAMMDASVKLKSLGEKRKHPLSPEYIRSN